MTRTDATARPSQDGPSGEHKHDLQADGVSAAGSVVMAVAGSAPAYSIAATTATLVAAAGLASPAALLWCGLPMLGIAWAFAYLGRADVNAGAAYSWVGRALHPILGLPLRLGARHLGDDLHGRRSTARRRHDRRAVRRRPEQRAARDSRSAPCGS